MHPTHTSIAAFLEDVVGGRRPPKNLAKLFAKDRPQQDPLALFGRCEWLLDFLLFAFRGYKIANWEERLARAPAVSEFEKELPQIASWPHLAVYWLWAHFLFGNGEELERARTAAAKSPFAAVKETLKILEGLKSSKPPALAKKVREFKKYVALTAPAQLLSKEAQRLRDSTSKVATKTAASENAALATLKSAANKEPKVKEALSLLSDFDRGRHVEQLPQWTWFEPQRRFAELVDSRFEPLVVARIKKAAKVGDDNRAATRGMVFAWARLSGSYARFAEVVDGAGTAKLGGDRLDELYRSLARFDEPEAIRRLAVAAGTFVEKWRTLEGRRHDEAFRALVQRDCPESQELIVRLLDTVDYSLKWDGKRLDPPFDEIIEAALAAGARGIKEAAKGIQRAIEAGLGTRSGEEVARGKLLRAAYLTPGHAGFDFVNGLYETHRPEESEIKKTRVDDVAAYHHERACLLGGMILMRPTDAAVRAAFKAHWERYLALRTVHADEFLGLIVLTRAVQLGKLEGFRPLLERTAKHSIKPFYAHRKADAELIRRIALETLEGPA